MRTRFGSTTVVMMMAATVVAAAEVQDAAAVGPPPLSTTSSTTSNDFQSIGRFVSTELHPAIVSVSPSSATSDISTRRRFLQDVVAVVANTNSYYADFDDICAEMQIIFNQQCSCGATTEQRSDRVTCQSGSSGGLEASAHFNANNNFTLETIQVCKQQACTVIHYQNRTGTKCEATYGNNEGQSCTSCRVCNAVESNGAMMGLEIDCTNVNPHMSVNCTAVSEILDLSGAARMGGGMIVAAAAAWTVVVAAASSSPVLAMF
jgi:hypothetical protein